MESVNKNASTDEASPAGPDRLAIARALRDIGQLLRIKGENPFRARAYERGAQALESLQGDLGSLVDAGSLGGIGGIGSGLASVIEELHRTGRSTLLDSLRAEMPAGVLELARVPSLSLGRVAALQRELGIESLADLEAACAAGRVRSVRGFGEKTELRLLEELRRLREGQGTVLLHRALAVGERLIDHLRGAADVERADLAGVLRRRHETVSRLDVVATGPSPAAAIERFLSFPLVEGGAARSERACAVRLANGLPARLEWVPPAEYPPALVRLTGSAEHVARLEVLAESNGLRLAEDGLHGRDGALELPDEAALYSRLGLPYVAPELREDEGEIEAALAGTVPQDLVSGDDIQGMVHCHTVYSDGRNTVLQMARAAEALGMRFITITDHSPTASYAGGLDLDRLKKQWEEIDRAQEQVGIRIFRGTESDILADGSLDYPDEVLERFDVIVASVHSRHKMDAAQMTRRLVRALSLPVFKIWGHARGRLIGRRPPFECDMEGVLDAAARSRVAIEVNGDPHRLDMEPRWIRAARERGLRFVLSVDAHSVGDLGYLRYAVDTARRGWVRSGEVLNALAADDFAREVRPA
jgi:DNA polymerase (family 10)